MRNLRVIVITIVIIAFCLYSYLNNREVKVIDAHHNKYTAEILVDHLPFSKSASIDWWLNNQDEIRSKYKIPFGEKGPIFITIYAFGDGYKEEGKKDRLCFDDVKPPKNCIDKDILMSVNRTRNGDTEFGFEYSAYFRTKDGTLIKSDDRQAP